MKETGMMMTMMADEMSGMDMMVMQEAMEACSAAEQACTMCSGSMMMSPEMGRCMAMCMSMADVANTMMRMMMRPAGMDMPSMMAMMKACSMMAVACAQECMMHAETNSNAAMCAEVCRNMAMSMDKAMAMMEKMA